MGSGLSTSSRAAVKLTNDKCYRTDSNRNQFKLEPVILSRGEVDGILEDDSHKVGTYILYEDLEKEKMYLAFNNDQDK
ncbi:hypothetical protein HNY73_009462 [Argiope bruennichi]|uniref:Uncharacterized protein n=1 Tax=Argiope bruennichi TaxID=94029 RepID=A0A8T0FC58_ARGBR|nr:hypothetical protein HNY73_009462 [Argiope bruennichi]